MRVPTDRAAAWAPWRRMLAGERVGVTDTPLCGWWKAKRFGRYVAVQIDIESDCDDEGALVSDERVVAWIGDERFDGDAVCDIWIRCAAHPLSEAEFERLRRMPVIADLSRQVIV